VLNESRPRLHGAATRDSDRTLDALSITYEIRLANDSREIG